MTELIAHPEGVYALDAQYVRPQLAAIHLIVHKGAVALVDTGSAASCPHVLAALEKLGLEPEAVRYILLSHIHLDHAGGAGALMAALPQAKLVLHSRGARHMADPAKLWAGTVAVYGEAVAVERYGALQPIAAERIVEPQDGAVIDLAGRLIHVLDTPGHARHHLCYHDPAGGGIFTGDTFGLSYRELDVAGRPAIFPTTTPVHFDPEAMHASIERLVALRPDAMYLTHFSRVTEVDRLAAELHRLIDAHVAIAGRHAGAGAQRHACILADVTALLLEEWQRGGWPVSEAELLAIFADDLELNAQGLGVWLDQRTVVNA